MEKHKVLAGCRLALWSLLSLSMLASCSEDKTSTREEDAEYGDDEEDSADDEATEDDEEPAKPDKKDAGRDAGSLKDASGTTKRDSGKGDDEPASDASRPVDMSSVPSPTFVDGPMSGDPSKPVVSIPDVACGGPKGGLDSLVGGGSAGGFPVPGTPNLKIGGRDVILSYPCDKHEGAPVTFILNLHGTMPSEELKFYQHGYFAAHKLTTSHNLIVASPKSVVSQWANGDGGKDAPHLYEVIDWVYSKFSKFKITGLWVAGHSWGSMFAKSFVCDAMLKERARGVIGMSGGTSGVGGGIGFAPSAGGASTAGCADRISQIHTVGDAEAGATGGLPDQTAAATKHGCGARSGAMDIGNGQLLRQWPDCQPGWVHTEYTMGAHEHTTPINPEVVQKIVEQIKSTESR